LIIKKVKNTADENICNELLVFALNMKKFKNMRKRNEGIIE
jgi:hypothetical protein